MKKFSKPGEVGSDLQESSMVSEISYNAISKTLNVTFHNGNKYEYLNVPEEVSKAAYDAESVGSYLRNNVFKVYSQNKLN